MPRYWLPGAAARMCSHQDSSVQWHLLTTLSQYCGPCRLTKGTRKGLFISSLWDLGMGQGRRRGKATGEIGAKWHQRCFRDAMAVAGSFKRRIYGSGLFETAQLAVVRRSGLGARISAAVGPPSRSHSTAVNSEDECLSSSDFGTSEAPTKDRSMIITRLRHPGRGRRSAWHGSRAGYLQDAGGRPALSK